PEPVVDTAVSEQAIRAVGEAHLALPEGFTPHKRANQLLQRRARMAVEGNIGWAFGAILAYGTLLAEGVTVRRAGQDSRRGPVAARRSGFVGYNAGGEFVPRAGVVAGGARFVVYDSLLSAFAAMGVEYGYSVENPEALVLWEAECGDFA